MVALLCLLRLMNLLKNVQFRAKVSWCREARPTAGLDLGSHPKRCLWSQALCFTAEFPLGLMTLQWGRYGEVQMKKTTRLKLAHKVQRLPRQRAMI